MQKWKKYCINIAFMLLILAATFYVLLKDQDLPEIASRLRGADQGQMGLAMLAAFLYLLLQSGSLSVIFGSLGVAMRLTASLRYSFIGFLFNALTPSAGGGQPMQVLYMKMDGINIGVSSVALLFWTILYKVALLLIEGVILLWDYDFVAHALGHYQWLFWVGILVNFVSIVLYGVVVFSKNGAKMIVHFAAWLLHKLRIVRHRERTLRKLDTLLESYQEGAVYMRTHFNIAGIVLVITVLQRLCYFMAAWFVIRALGVSDISMGDVMILQSLVSVCIDILPFPGGVGVNESFFAMIFQTFIGKQAALSAMLLSRGVNFYGLLVISVFVTLWSQMRHMGIGRQQEKGSD